MIEILESRIAPAAVYSYMDTTGDKVTIVTSKGTNAELAAAAGNITTGQLQELNLSSAVFAGTDVTITARLDGGKGASTFANVGEIYADQMDLGSVTVHGDLTEIVAGSGTGYAVKSLTVQSLGRLASSTGVGSNASNLVGKLGALNVKTDVVGVFVTVTGTVGPVTIGGSLIGGPSADNGYLQSTGNMGFVKIGGDVEGGSGILTGAIYSGGTIAGVSVGGSVIGGALIPGGSAAVSGSIVCAADMGAVKIGHNLAGGEDFESGFIGAGFGVTGFVDPGYAAGPGGSISSVTIGGSIIGGSGGASGVLGTYEGNIGPVKIRGDLYGGTGVEAGGISSTSALAGLTIGGSLIGGSAIDAGAIRAGGNIGPVKIGGSIYAGQVAKTGAIFSTGLLSSLTVTGSIMGNASVPVLINASGPTAHSATADVTIGSVSIGGEVVMADIEAGYLNGAPADGSAQIGAVRVGGDWIASNLVAGVENTASGNRYFGNSGDAPISAGATILSRIASFTIGGQVQGTPASVNNSDNFGFVAQTIGSFSVDGAVITLPAKPVAFQLEVGATGDVDIHALGS